MNATTALIRYPRRFDLAWTQRPEDEKRFRRIFRSAVGTAIVLGIVFPLLPLPERSRDLIEAVPERFVRLVERKPPPAPVPPAPQPVEPVPAVEVPPVAEVAPAPPRTVRERTQIAAPAPRKPVPDARERAARAGLLPLQNQLALLRDNVAVTKAAQTRNLSGAVGATTRSERALVTAGVAKSSGGINTSTLSRGYGAGGGALDGHETAQVEGSFGIAAAGAGAASSPREPRGGGAATRSREDIDLVFDRNKSAIYALYSRALRSNRQLQGKLVLELTIAPSGEVTACQVVSSELGDADLERKLVARVKMFRFEARDVATVTTTKPIDFFPA
jgi:TonB family protein